MFHVEHRDWANPGRVPSMGRGKINGCPTVPLVLGGFADRHDSPVNDPWRGKADCGLGRAKSSAGHHVNRSVVVAVAKGLRITTHGSDTTLESQAEDCSLHGVDPFCPAVNKKHLKVGPCDGDHKPWHPRTGAEIRQYAGSSRNDLDERERVVNDVSWGNGPKCAHALGLSEDAKKPGMCAKIRHGDDPSG